MVIGKGHLFKVAYRFCGRLVESSARLSLSPRTQEGLPGTVVGSLSVPVPQGGGVPGGSEVPEETTGRSHEILSRTFRCGSC